MIQPEHYFSTHPDTAGQEVTRCLKVPVLKYGYESSKNLFLKEVTIPVFDEGLTIIRAYRYDAPLKESEKNKPHFTLVYIGGGSADAKVFADLPARIEDLQEKITLPFYINRVIILPHVSGSARTKKPKPTKEKTLAIPAKILHQALQSPSLNPGENLIFMGLSLGGAQAAELVCFYQEKTPYLLLTDPAGMAEHGSIKLLWQFSIGTLIALLKKHHFNLMDVEKEVRTAWGGTEGIPSWKTLISGGQNWRQILAEAYGFKNDQAEISPDINIASHDSTKKARKSFTGHVIFAPALYAKVVNVILSRLKDKYPNIEMLKKVDSDTLNTDVCQMLKEMFPRAASVQFIYVSETTHHSLRTQQNNLEKIFQELGKNPSFKSR